MRGEKSANKKHTGNGPIGTGEKSVANSTLAYVVRGIRKCLGTRAKMDIRCIRDLVQGNTFRLG